MCIGGSTPPAPAPLPAPAPPAPTRVDPEVRKAKTQNRQRAALAAGRNSTIVTGSQGLSGESSGNAKTVLGT